MADPTISATDALGLKLAWIVAGFAGGVVSLSFVRNLTVFQAVLAVFTGAVSAGYLTPAAVHYLSLSSSEIANCAAFVIGITAMNVIPGIIKLSESFKRNPDKYIGGGK